MPWYLYIALKQLFPSGRRFPFFTIVATCGVALGVTALLVVLSVMNGFGYEIRQKIVDTQGDLLVQTSGVMHHYRPLMKRLEADPMIKGVAPFAAGEIGIQYNNQPRTAQVDAIDPRFERNVVPWSKFLVMGNLQDLDDDSVFLSSGLAQSLGVTYGDKVELISPLLLEKLKRNEVLLPREVRVAGIFETGWNQIDANTLICDLSLMQDMYDLGDGVHGLRIRLKPGIDADTAAAALQAKLGSHYHVYSWLDTNRDFLFVLQLEKNMMFFLLLIIVLVSAFAITSSLLITVVRKTKEIGLFGALGGKPWQIGLCYCFQGFLLGVAGTLAGLGLGFTLLYFRNDIVHLLTRLTGSQAAMLRFYQFSNLPSHTAGSDLASIIILSIVISTLAGLIPALRAARLRPTEAFRNE